VTLVSVAVEDVGTSDRVEIQLRDRTYNRTSQQLNVRVNGKYVQFDDKSMFWQDLNGNDIKLIFPGDV